MKFTIRLVCNQCGRVSYYTPCISQGFEDLGCRACNANLCTLISEDEEIKQ